MRWSPHWSFPSARSCLGSDRYDSLVEVDESLVHRTIVGPEHLDKMGRGAISEVEPALDELDRMNGKGQSYPSTHISISTIPSMDRRILAIANDLQ